MSLFFSTASSSFSSFRGWESSSFRPVVKTWSRCGGEFPFDYTCAQWLKRHSRSVDFHPSTSVPSHLFSINKGMSIPPWTWVASGACPPLIGHFPSSLQHRHRLWEPLSRFPLWPRIWSLPPRPQHMTSDDLTPWLVRLSPPLLPGKAGTAFYT